MTILFFTLTIISSFVLTYFFGASFINKMKTQKVEQVVRVEGPESHYHKNGTPTMGGVIFIIVITFLVFIRFLLVDGTAYLDSILFLFVFLGYALIGFIDDYLKVIQKQNLGLSSRNKLLSQIFISVFTVIIMFNNNMDTSITFYLFDFVLELGFFYYIFIFFILIGASNATNLTDGVDGLLSFNAIISFLGLLTIFYLLGATGLGYITSCLIGGLLAFLIFNKNPAKIFMGDVGSLAIGAGLAMLAILGNVEMLLV